MLRYNLQYFAKDGPGGEKTEPATSKKLTDARKEGQVAKSREIANGLGLITLFLVLKFTIESLGQGLIDSFQLSYNKIPEFAKPLKGELTVNDMSIFVGGILGQILLLLAPFLLVGFVVAFFSDFVQVKWAPTSKPLKPKFSKMNPLKGVKKLFSKESLVELLKSALKIALIVYVVYSTLKDQWQNIFLLYDIPLLQAVLLIGDIAVSLGYQISLIYMLIAFGDFVYQKIKFKEDMKMTKQEVKDEWKNSEGDPQVKGKIKQKMREISQRRMMQSLPQADVVITNPTHYAVAIKYDANVSDAPIVVAKGEDFLAQKIKEMAKEYKVEIVENKPLARMLYANVEIGESVPPELYQAVAEVLAMVYHMQGKV